MFARNITSRTFLRISLPISPVTPDTDPRKSRRAIRTRTKPLLAPPPDRGGLVGAKGHAAVWVVGQPDIARDPEREVVEPLLADDARVPPLVFFLFESYECSAHDVGLVI